VVGDPREQNGLVTQKKTKNEITENEHFLQELTHYP